MRSWLSVPGLSESGLADGFASGADVMVIDLPAVHPPLKQAARDTSAAFLQHHRGTAKNPMQRYVALHPLISGLTQPDLDALMPSAPDGVVIDADSGAEVQQLDVMLSVKEARLGLTVGSTRIVAGIGGSAASLFSVATLRGASARLVALAWDATGLGNALGATRSHDGHGRLTDVQRFSRSTALLAAAHAGIDIIDAASGLLTPELLTRDCREAHADGFTGKFAIHAAQLPVINALFAPSGIEIDHARTVLDLFAEAGSPPLFAPDGTVLTPDDRRRAERLLRRAGLGLR